jgi:hypothetical protein
VLERRRIDPVGMTPTLRLLELTRVTEEDEAPRGARDGDDVGERHLASFVHEEHIHRAREVRPSPHPRRAAEDLNRPEASASRASWLLPNMAIGAPLESPSSSSLCPMRSDASASWTSASRLRITLWLVAHTHALPLPDERRDHARAAIGFFVMFYLCGLMRIASRCFAPSVIGRRPIWPSDSGSRGRRSIETGKYDPSLPLAFDIAELRLTAPSKRHLQSRS